MDNSNAHTVEWSWAHQQHLNAAAQALEQRWREKPMRLEYAADLARRRYEQVDPANRLVAQTLETEGNRRLEDVETARQAYAAQRPTAQNLTSTAEQMQAAVAQLQPLWYGEDVNLGEKKELLRCAVEPVFLESRGPVIGVRVGWYGGAVSELAVPKYLFSAPQVYHCVRDLAQTQTDAEIATQLRDCIKTNYLICMTMESASSRLKPAGSRFYIKFFLKINRRFFDSLSIRGDSPRSRTNPGPPGG